jgi:hypothetical protein
VGFTFRGQPLTIVEEEIYLGVMLHSWKDMCYAAEHRATAASKSLHAMLSKCKRKGIYQPAFLCRIFDVLVLPVLSYGEHVWGPGIYVSGVLDRPFAQRKQVGKGALGVSQTHYRYGKERA